MSNMDQLMGLPPEYLMFDISNILHKTFYANKNVDEVTTAGLAHQSALMTLNKYFKRFKPDKVIMTFDRSNWRKHYTQSELCISKKLYKGNRRQDLTASQQLRYDLFCEHIAEFENLMRKHTGIICLGHDGLEADDFMAGVVQKFSKEARITMVSADKDLMQLLINDNVRLIDPATGDDRYLDEHRNSPDFFMFEKCLRGDQGDNVQSAYPRIRATKIHEAYDDPYVCETIMNHTWNHPDGRTMKVKELFEENSLLMDLRNQPEPVRETLDKVITEEFENPGDFSYFHFIKFCGGYDMERVVKSIDQFTPMLKGYY